MMNEGKVHDPVCGMWIDPARAAGSSQYKGETIYFCNPGCKAKFDADPEKYMAGQETAQPAPMAHVHDAVRESGRPQGAPTTPDSRLPTPDSGGTGGWTCPMHPEIVRDAPGSCPICGMALEPRTVTLEERENPELVDMTRRFWVSVALTAAARSSLAMGGMIPGARAIDRTAGGRRGAHGSSSLLATPVVLWGGWPFFERAWSSVVNRSLNMFTLIGLGVGGRVRLQRRRDARAGDLSRTRSATHGGRVGVYFEAAAVIVTLVLLGQVLELRARSRTGAAIRALLGLAPKTARRDRGRRQRGRRAAREVQPGDACACAPARRSRSTASSLEGTSSVDESMVTGEPIPVEKTRATA